MHKAILRALLVVAVTAASGAAQSAPAPRTADGHPDFNGLWKGTKDTVPTGNIAKDLPGLNGVFGLAILSPGITLTVSSKGSAASDQ